jgi:hypothetical protein
MSDQIAAPIALDLAVRSAVEAQAAALHVSQSACGVVYPFGTLGDRPCPVCDLPVHQHLGHADQRRVEARVTTFEGIVPESLRMFV